MPRSINSSVADRLSEQDIFGPAPLFYGLDYKIVGSSVAQYTDRDSQPAPIVTWLETGDWQTKKMAWPSDPRDILIDRRHILVADEREGCLKVLDNQRPVQEVSSSLSTALSRFSNVDVIQPARDLGEKQDCQSLAREEQQVSDAIVLLAQTPGRRTGRRSNGGNAQEAKVPRSMFESSPQPRVSTKHSFV